MRVSVVVLIMQILVIKEGTSRKTVGQQKDETVWRNAIETYAIIFFHYQRWHVKMSISWHPAMALNWLFTWTWTSHAAYIFFVPPSSDVPSGEKPPKASPPEVQLVREAMKKSIASEPDSITADLCLAGRHKLHGLLATYMTSYNQQNKIPGDGVHCTRSSYTRKEIARISGSIV